MAAVGRVTLSSGARTVKSLVFIGGGAVTEERKAGLKAAVYD
jgi:hypothetical protein